MPRKHRQSRLREPKACQACAYAKVKCEAETEDTCRRCLRLKRECITQAPGAHKRTGEKSSDVARLEQKLDSMAAVFTASSHAISEGRDGPTRSLFPADEEAQVLLHTFQTEMAPYFPFVAVPINTTASELRQTKPFLFRAILMVSCDDDADRQLAMAYNIREEIAALIVAQGEKNISLLQGLLVCLGWYHFQLELGSPCNILQLAWAMVMDLGLNMKPSQSRMVPMDGLFGDNREQSAHRTLEERRAYLGCFYLSSVVSTYLKNMGLMRYSAYTEECCRVLENAGEYYTDLYLVRMVRLHRLTDRIERIFSFNENEIGLAGVSPTPIALSIKTLAAELQRLKPSIPSVGLASNGLHDSILLMHHHTLEISLYSIALEDDFPGHGSRASERVNLLFLCLSPTKALLDIFTSIDSRNYINLPYPMYAAFFHAVGILSKLLLFAGEDWDQGYARGLLDVPTVVDMVIANIEKGFEESRNDQPPYCFPGTFIRHIPRLQAFKERHEAGCAATRGNEAGDAASSFATQNFVRDIVLPLPHGMSWQFLPSTLKKTS